MQIVKILDASTGDLTTQDVQNALYAALEKAGVKSPASEYAVKNSGGFRTYMSQMVCLGLFWKDRKRKQYGTTYAGEVILEAKEPAKVLRCQLLRMQYPSVYGLGNNVSIDSSLQVKPFVFLVKLLEDERLQGYLTSNDLAIPVVYGRTFSDYELCVSKILNLRQGNSLRTEIDSVDDLRTPKRNHPDDEERDWQLGLDDTITIGNTARNYLIASGIAVQSTIEKTAVIQLTDDQNVLEEIKEWMRDSTKIESLDVDYQEAWQQRFGRFNKTKAQRKLDNTKQKNRLFGITSSIQATFIAENHDNPFGFDINAFVSEESKRWNLSEAEISKMIAPLVPKISTIQYETVLQAAMSGGQDALLLERAITNLMKELGFSESEHIGQKKAPRRGGYPDIRVLVSTMPYCGFADTKATSHYSIGGQDMNKLGTYYKNCWKEFDDQRPSEYFLYIAGGFSHASSTIEKNLTECTQLYGKPVSAVTVQALLRLAQMPNRPNCEYLTKAFSKGKYFASAESIIQATC